MRRRYRRLIQDLQERPSPSECTLLLDAVRSAHAARDAAVASTWPDLRRGAPRGHSAGRSHMRGVRPDLPEWVDGLDQVHKLALIDAMERLDAGIKQARCGTSTAFRSPSDSRNFSSNRESSTCASMIYAMGQPHSSRLVACRRV